MKKIMMVFGFLLMSVNIYATDTAGSNYYDICEGSLSTGGFSNKIITYTVKVSPGARLYNPYGTMVIHMNGTSTDYVYLLEENSHVTEDLRFFQGYLQDDKHQIAQLSLDLKNTNKRTLTTNLSGQTETYPLTSCQFDKVDYPAPVHPPGCHTPHCL